MSLPVSIYLHFDINCTTGKFVVSSPAHWPHIHKCALQILYNYYVPMWGFVIRECKNCYVVMFLSSINHTNTQRIPRTHIHKQTQAHTCTERTMYTHINRTHTHEHTPSHTGRHIEKPTRPYTTCMPLIQSQSVYWMCQSHSSHKAVNTSHKWKIQYISFFKNSEIL